MGCSEKTSNICIDEITSRCVRHQGELSKNTEIKGECVSQYEVNQDLYKIIDNLILETYPETGRESCLNYPLSGDKVTPKTVMEKTEAEVCGLKDRVNDLEAKDILSESVEALDLKCLSDACGRPIKTLGELLEAIVNKLCPPSGGIGPNQ